MNEPTFDVSSEDDDAPVTDSVSQSERDQDDADADRQDEPGER